MYAYFIFTAMSCVYNAEKSKSSMGGDILN